jgi:hypothetical protein
MIKRQGRVDSQYVSNFNLHERITCLKQLTEHAFAGYGNKYP